MSEFLRYVLWELRRYFVLALLAGLFALGVVLVFRSFYRRKFGKDVKFPWKRVLLPLLFLGYLALVFFVTNFRTGYMRREANLHLFRAWREALNNFSQHRWLNVLLNIAMFGPFGFLLPLLSRKCRKWYLTIPAGFGYSLVIELLQLAFARGIFDVDDLFCNTLGGAMGYFAVMVVLSACSGKRWKAVLSYLGLLLLSLGSVGSVFLTYHVQEFGNLPEAAAYRLHTADTVWTLECELPEARDSAPVYRTQPRTQAECDAFAQAFQQIIPTLFEDISYYQEAAYYMDHGNGDGAHFLYVHYLDQGYEYIAILDDEPVWVDADRETVLKALEKYPLQVPDAAEFFAEGDGWHRFALEQMAEGEDYCGGNLRVRMAQDGTIREIENSLLSYTYYRNAAVISPGEAYAQLCAGKFQDGDFFEMKKPSELSVLACVMEYRVDTKGFYQPVYVFDVQSPDGDYQSRAMIPALK